MLLTAERSALIHGRRAPLLSTDVRSVLEAAATAGVSRLAEVTDLDLIGIPVFQAIRPAGLSLSVHQGKGVTREAAMIGALMEAVECDRAEQPVGEPWTRAFASLPPLERAPSLADFAVESQALPSDEEPLEWLPARRLRDGARVWIPMEVVRLDFTRHGDPRLERSTVGLGARFDIERATLKGLLEVVERDAERAWFALSMSRRTRSRIDLESIGSNTFHAMRSRILGAGLWLSVYHLPAVIPVPVFLAEIIEAGAGGVLRHIAVGSACDVTAEGALIGAVLEAAQSRLTAISGARDDIFYSETPPAAGDKLGVALPQPPHIRSLSWDSLGQWAAPTAEANATAIAESLGEAGYPDAVVVDLASPGADVSVIKALVPGLGSSARARRNVEKRGGGPR
jgi:ribosomal protein S12 methylthiotransferase accessory factor